MLCEFTVVKFASKQLGLTDYHLCEVGKISEGFSNSM